MCPIPYDIIKKTAGKCLTLFTMILLKGSWYMSVLLSLYFQKYSCYISVSTSL